MRRLRYPSRNSEQQDLVVYAKPLDNRKSSRGKLGPACRHSYPLKRESHMRYNALAVKSRGGFYASLLSTVALSVQPAAADELTKYHAVMATYFMREHIAIPIFNTGRLSSAEVIALPTEAPVYSRDQCYTLDPVKYSRMSSEDIESQGAIGLQIGASADAEKVIAVVANASGRVTSASHITLNPLSDEVPRRGSRLGLSVLMDPKPACPELANILQGTRTANILITRVFWASVTTRTSFEIEGNADAAAKVRLEGELQRILGRMPKVSIAADGKSMTVEVTSSVEPHAVAVQSAVLNPNVLAHVYAAVNGKNRTLAQLESEVARYLGSDRTSAEVIATDIRSLLIQLEIIKRDPNEFYDDLYSGVKVPGVPVEKIQSDKQTAAALGTVAGAVEIARSASMKAFAQAE